MFLANEDSPQDVRVKKGRMERFLLSGTAAFLLSGTAAFLHCTNFGLLNELDFIDLLTVRTWTNCKNLNKLMDWSDQESENVRVREFSHVAGVYLNNIKQWLGTGWCEIASLFEPLCCSLIRFVSFYVLPLELSVFRWPLTGTLWSLRDHTKTLQLLPLMNSAQLLKNFLNPGSSRSSVQSMANWSLYRPGFPRLKSSPSLIFGRDDWWI